MTERIIKCSREEATKRVQNAVNCLILFGWNKLDSKDPDYQSPFDVSCTYLNDGRKKFEGTIAWEIWINGSFPLDIHYIDSCNEMSLSDSNYNRFVSKIEDNLTEKESQRILKCIDVCLFSDKIDFEVKLG